MHRGPWADIDLNAICANFAMIRSAVRGAKMSAVVKCDAYGLGMAPIARALAEREQCDVFFVVYPEEGVRLREALNAAEPVIYVFDGPNEQTLPLFEKHNLTPTLNSLDEAKLWTARMNGAPAGVHIDTGMNRRGAAINDIADIARLDLNITLAMSHLACGATPAHPKNRRQREMFIDAAAHFPGARLSLSASAGALMDPEFHFDLVRPGIALYGGTPFEIDDQRIAPAVALRAPIVQLHSLPLGETVGYGATFIAQRETLIATAAIGYGDGFPRAGGNRHQAVVNGARAPIAGRISMDFITLDVTDLEAPPRLGDMAEFFGPGMRLHETAKNCAMAPYDLLTGLGARVDRRYL